MTEDIEAQLWDIVDALDESRRNFGLEASDSPDWPYPCDDSSDDCRRVDGPEVSGVLGSSDVVAEQEQLIGSEHQLVPQRTACRRRPRDVKASVTNRQMFRRPHNAVTRAAGDPFDELHGAAWLHVVAGRKPS